MHSFQMTIALESYKKIYAKCEDYGSCRPFGIVVKCSEWSLKTSVCVVQCVLKAPTHILKAAPPGELNRFTSTACVASLFLLSPPHSLYIHLWKYSVLSTAKFLVYVKGSFE